MLFGRALFEPVERLGCPNFLTPIAKFLQSLMPNVKAGNYHAFLDLNLTVHILQCVYLYMVNCNIMRCKLHPMVFQILCKMFSEVTLLNEI